ncbi:hypothetical protein, partial [Ralstonia pseudosolanacearum]|uniref:hypothetical protein n=1 Tax=Ralstonia pseudosolanacearum TaxID=1310165 RepID=UPI0026748D9C
ADLLSCHANNNAQPPAFDDLVLLATLSPLTHQTSTSVFEGWIKSRQTTPKSVQNLFIRHD